MDLFDKLIMSASFFTLGLVTANFVTSPRTKIDKKDLNGDRIPEIIISEGKKTEYIISLPGGKYEYGELSAESGMGFIKLPESPNAFYKFGEIRKDGTNWVYDSDKIIRVDINESTKEH